MIVRGENAKKIKSAMKELNYRPDKLVEKRNYTIEILGASSQKSLSKFQGYAEMMVGMIKTLEKGGATVQVHSGSSKYIPRADGVIAYGLAADVEDEIIETLKRRNIPEKLQGFKDCMAAHNLQLPSYLVYAGNGDDELKAWMNEILDNKDYFTAFFALTDAVAFEFMDNAQQRGFKIPEDFAVVGMDGTAEAFYSRPRLTSVAIPFNEIGKKSAEAIFELIDNPDTVCIRKYLKYEISCRQSD